MQYAQFMQFFDFTSEFTYNFKVHLVQESEPVQNKSRDIPKAANFVQK